MTGDRRGKRTHKRTGPPNNFNSERPDGPMETSRAGRIALTTIATTTHKKRWTPAITPDKWEKEGHCRGTTEVNTRRERL